MTSPPHTIALIPARGGSKRIPRKNLWPVAGLPLFAHSIRHAREARSVSEVYVSTEDEEIASAARAFGAEVIARPAELAEDTATSESALLHALDERNRRGFPDPDLVVFLQPTSPIRRPDDIDRAVATLIKSGADSLFSACENNRLIWARKDGQPVSLTYDFQRRQREQDMAVQFRENGSIYVFRPAILREHNNRLGGKMAVYEMDYWTSFQVDTPEQAELCEWILRRPEFRPPVAWPERVALVVFDFDGVMTDNTAIVASDGTESVRVQRGDGWGIARLRKLGVPMLVLSTETNPVVAARCAKLQISCEPGVSNKAAWLASYLSEQDISPEHVIYVGNDVNDLEAMRLVGMPVAVADSHPAVLAAARLVLRESGGRGAVRKFCDLLVEHLSEESGAPPA